MRSRRGPVSSPINSPAIDAERARRRASESASFSLHMQRFHGAPAGTMLTPEDCYHLEKTTREAGKTPPAWVASAARAWRVANDLEDSQRGPHAGP